MNTYQPVKMLILPVLVLCVVITSTAFPQAKNQQQFITPTCPTTVAGMSMLTQNLVIPSNFDTWNDSKIVRLGNEFDVNQYFTILTKLSMEPGYTLDYVYSGMLGNGSPTLYARNIDAERLTTFSEYEQAISGSGTEVEFFWSHLGDIMNDNTPVDFTLPDKAYSLLRYGYLSHVQVEDSEIGYFQLALLYLLGDQFYLQWHAYYDDEAVVCDQYNAYKILDDLENADISDWSNQQIKQLRAQLLNVTYAPSVTLKDKTAEVQLTYFTKWGGLFRATYLISREAPHMIIPTKPINLLYYHCGIMF